MSVSTAQATGKDFDTERITRWDAIRHPGLRDRLTAEAADLRAQAARAEQTAEQLRDRMRELTEQTGSDQDLRRAPFEARVAADHHERDHQAAQAADQRDIDHLHRQVDSHSATAEKATTTVDEAGRRAAAARRHARRPEGPGVVAAHLVADRTARAVHPNASRRSSTGRWTTNAPTSRRTSASTSTAALA
jgi:hypothetical protein